MIDKILRSVKVRMEKNIENLKDSFSRLRTGRAHPSFLEHIMVDYYNNPTPLAKVANVVVENARTLKVIPWEKEMVSKIEKAIIRTDLGLNPVTNSNTIHVPLPVLTEERRKSLAKLVNEESEKGRILLRNIRREANEKLKKLVKSKEITKDDERRAQTQIQKITDTYIENVHRLTSEKENDLMAV